MQQHFLAPPRGALGRGQKVKHHLVSTTKSISKMIIPNFVIVLTNEDNKTYHRSLAGYSLPPPRGNFVNHIFLEAQCLARILQHVSPLTMAALSCNSLLHVLPYKIFDNGDYF